MLLIPAAFIFIRRKVKLSRRRSAFEKPLPRHLEKLVDEIPLCRKIPQALRTELRGHINVFLSEKSFEGCRGQVVNDEMKLKIAAQACVLLLNRNTDYFPRLTSLLIYPDAYWVNDNYEMAGQAIRGRTVNLGESWEQGAVVLSWKQISDELADENCGHNLVLHEFAHQIDAEDGFLNGLPDLGEGASYGKWADVFEREYDDLRDGTFSGVEDVIDDYGAEDPAEFFAVVTEGFFMKPLDMRRAHPELYSELVKFYRLDPAGWNNP